MNQHFEWSDAALVLMALMVINSIARLSMTDVIITSNASIAHLQPTVQHRRLEVKDTRSEAIGVENDLDSFDSKTPQHSTQPLYYCIYLGKSTLDHIYRVTMSRFSRKKRKKRFDMRAFALVSHPLFLGLAILLGAALSISFLLVATHPDVHVAVEISAENTAMNGSEERQLVRSSGGIESEIGPEVPYFPPFAEIEDSEKLITDTLNGKPTIAGIVAQLNKFLKELHESNLKNSKEKLLPNGLVQGYFDLATQYLRPLDEPYRGKPIFEIREDDSIFISLAAFREHLLTQTLKSAFDQAKNPENLFIGAVVQNCFGTDGRQCKTGLQVIGKNAQGRDQVKMSDAPPDVNGIEEFCRDPLYKKYCKSGHIRALYLHDTDALGPAVARYYASKLWAGESYFLQMDSHLGELVRSMKYFQNQRT